MDADTISVLCMDGDEYLMELSKTRYKLSVAEECFIGFSSRDHSTQTDKNEILDMKELVDIIDTLAVDTNEMKKDVNFMRSLMKADFESKLKAKSIEIYVRMNERLSVIDKIHKETIKTIRSACKQQLVDAVAQIHRYYNGDIERKLSNHMQKTTTTDRRIKELEALTKTNESTIQMLLLRLAKYEDEEENTIEQVEIQSYKSESPDLIGQLEEERDNLKEEMAKQSEQLVKAEEELAQKENICRELKKEFESVNRKYEDCKKIIHELKAEKIELLSNMEQNRVANQKVLEIQKLALQKERDEALMKSKQATEHVTEIRRAPEDVDQIAKLLQENKKLSLQLNKEIENKEMQKLFQKDFEKFKTKEEKLMKEIGRLQNELKQVGIAWEKKFKILQQSMYALKDESYLRQTLLRQSAMLHQATVSYAYESPVNTKAGSLFNKALDIKTSPLPAIGQHRPATSADFISYTVTPPNDRRTFVFSANENQIMSDDEDLPTDVQPFPLPPTNGMIT